MEFIVSFVTFSICLGKNLKLKEATRINFLEKAIIALSITRPGVEMKEKKKKTWCMKAGDKDGWRNRK